MIQPSPPCQHPQPHAEAGVRVVVVAVVRVGVVCVDIAAVFRVINVLGPRHCADICGVYGC